ncbi:GNAT family N-acetyltransferase [Heyndrickxia acidicola]|nr:GNAT family protein [Heyndrickxia acidicola]
MEFPEFHLNRILLKEITLKDSKAYFNIMKLDAVTQFYGMESLKTEEEAAALIQSLAELYEANRAIRFGIFLKETNEFIGTAGLNNLQLKNKRAEIGYELHPDYWRKGYTSEAVKAILQYAFSDLDLYRIGAVTFPENNASQSLLIRLGFQQEGLLRGYLYQHNRSNDALIFSLLQPEWKKIIKWNQDKWSCKNHAIRSLFSSNTLISKQHKAE